jgi:pyruvate/2-oxoglutarate dehydrogenase complex dihydrolipoamide dehydrogenase (E3) component
VTEREFDVVVLGMGPGGEFVATKLAGAGVPVAAVEQRLVGGECHFWGCIPSGMMVRAGDLLAEGRRIPGMAGRLLAQDEPEASALITKVFRREGITVHTGAPAKSVSHDSRAFTVAVRGGPQVTGERLLVATGRRADLASLGVGAIGQDEHASYLEVDENMRAAAPLQPGRPAGRC